MLSGSYGHVRVNPEALEDGIKYSILTSPEGGLQIMVKQGRVSAFAVLILITLPPCFLSFSISTTISLPLTSYLSLYACRTPRTCRCMQMQRNDKVYKAFLRHWKTRTYSF